MVLFFIICIYMYLYSICVSEWTEVDLICFVRYRPSKNTVIHICIPEANGNFFTDMPEPKSFFERTCLRWDWYEDETRRLIHWTTGAPVRIIDINKLVLNHIWFYRLNVISGHRWVALHNEVYLTDINKPGVIISNHCSTVRGN